MPAQQGNNLSISQIRDGLINPNFTTPLYVSANSFTVAGDVTSWLRPGRGLVISFQTSGVKRGTVVSLSYDSGTNKTTINTIGDSLVNETITSVLLSLSDGENIISAGLSKVRAEISAYQSIASGSFIKVKYDLEIFDGLNEYDESTGIFTAKYSGWYFVDVKLLFGSASWNAEQLASLAIFKNGSEYSHLNYVVVEANITKYLDVLGSDSVYLTKNDYIEIYIYQNRGSNLDIIGGKDSHLSIFRFS